jgi:transglutaminase-like putative cysteine protease
MQIQARLIPGGDAGVLGATLPRMQALIRQARVNALVRGAAARIVGGCAPEDGACRVRRIYSWVKARIRFVPDPRRVELLHEPLAMLYTIRRQEWAAGDCDDMAILIAALLESIGTATRLRVVSIRGGDPPPLHHVFAEAKVDGAWVRLDPLGERYASKLFTRSVALEV